MGPTHRRRAIVFGLVAVVAAGVALVATSRPRTGPAAVATACGTPAGQAKPAAAVDFNQPRGPQEWEPDPATFEAVLARTGAHIEMTRFSTNLSHATPSQAANIALVARRLTGVVVPAGAVFSYNRTLGPFTAANGYGWGRMFLGQRIVPSIGGGVCQGASTLYNVVLLADLPVVERHPHGLTVPYLPPGRDATVSDDADLDFRFRNNTGGPLVLWGQVRGRTLTLAMYGTRKPPAVRIETRILATYPFATETLPDPKLPRGQERVAAPGQEGARSRTWIEVETPHGWVRRDLHSDYYKPSPRIVMRGTGPPVPQTPPAESSVAAAPAA